ncbi:MAG: hypothetical protein HRU20_26995 [Pseudomonadales bacterium]|nr:hypothetical protein [Pseudomonadales bacterium]
MIVVNAELYFVLVGVAVFFMWGSSIFCFTRISLKHIETEMAKEGILPPAYDNGIGGRIVPYSMVILFPSINRHASLIDVESTLKHARKIDWYLALFLNVTSLLFFTLMLVCYFFFEPTI